MFLVKLFAHQHPLLWAVHVWLYIHVFCCHQYVFFFLLFSALALVQLTKAHRQGHMVKVDWLDRLTFREIEMINEVGLFKSACFFFL